MNILWITLESILPANSGGRLGVFKRLEQVAKTENIFLFYPYDSVSEEQEIEELLKAQGLKDKIKTMVGGAPVTSAWAEKIGATAYSDDAVECCDVALKLMAETR